MNDIDKINPCALSDNDIAYSTPWLNNLFNIVGILFFVTFLGYVTVHCL